MLPMEAAQVIREQVPTTSVLSLYGYSPNRDGFMRCPFHADKTASLKVYDFKPAFRKRGWYCFGCHAGGSVMDFVMLHDSCNFMTAVRAIDHALNLNLLTVEPWQDQESYRNLQRCLDDLEAVAMSRIDLQRRFLNIHLTQDYQRWAALDRIPRKERTAEEWTEHQNLLESLQYMEYQLSCLDSQRGEVISWRSKHRIRPRKTAPRSSRKSPQ